MQRVTVGELLDVVRSGAGLDQLLDDPVVVVDGGIGGEADEAASSGAQRELEAGLAGLPAVFLSVGGPASRSMASVLGDVVAADDAALDRLARVIDEHTDAAVGLAVLLRGGASRSIAEGLVAESATYSMLQAGPDHQRWLAASRPHARSTHSDGEGDCGGDGEPVLVERRGDVVRVTFHRPGVHNAFDAATRDALVEACAVVAADPSLSMVLDGAGPSFCSGGDLNEFGTRPDVATAHRVRLRRSAGRALAAIADRVTVEVHGACAGAGVELPAFAGRVIARPDTRFWLPEVAMGLVPGAGGTVSIARRIGAQRTAWLALTGEPIDAAVALDWGLVDELS